MRRYTLLWLLPAVAAFGAPSLLAPTSVLAPATAPAGDLDELQAEYTAAFEAWKAKFDVAQGRERSTLRKEHPAKDFWDRFEASGKAGEGRAYQWMLDHAKDLGLKRDERGPVIQQLYTALLEGSADQGWFDEVVSRIIRDARYLEAGALQRWLEAASEDAKSTMARALARVSHAQLLTESDDAGLVAMGKRMLAEYEEKNIAVGATALDFSASTIDGHRFKLSDYRGKVVLVDFYGFW
jgi:hypothetical protein